MMNIRQLTLISAIIVSFRYVASSQEQLGLRIDNYSGVNSITLNPASNLTYPLTWDLNLAGVGFMFHNNLGYIEKASISKVLKNTNGLGPDPALNIEYKGTPSLEYNFNTKNSFFASLNTRVMGPSFIINSGNGHTFGVFTGARVFLSSHSIPKIASPYELNRKDRGNTYALEPFQGSGMAWTEVGVNYAHNISDTETEGGLSIGANIKYLQAYQAFYIKNNKGTELTKISDDSLRINAMRGSLGYTTNYAKDNVDRPNGSGYAIDFGAVLTLPSSDNELPYQFRLGASLVDLGKVFFKQNVETHEIETKNAFVIDDNDFNNLDSNDPVADAIKRINQKAFNVPAKTRTGSTMSMGLPSAISLQADYCVMKNLFANALLIQRLPSNNIGLERDNLLAVTPRYESRWLGASLPISLINYQHLRVGLAARLGFLTLGTDHLLSFMSNSNLYGTDFYLALKVNPFRLFGSEKDYEPKAKKVGNSKVNCYRF